MFNPPRRLLPNLGLALMLCTLVGYWFWKAPADPAFQLAFGLLGLATVSLAALALLRPPARNSDTRWWVFPLCVLSMVYVLGYRFDQTQSSLRVLFLGRIALQFLAGLALLSLGRSYAMLPALREVRTGLLYGYVRHPVYALYMLADLGVVALQPSLWNAGVAAVGAAVFLLRASLEEQVLCNDSRYLDYMRQVRWRFFPGII